MRWVAFRRRAAAHSRAPNERTDWHLVRREWAINCAVGGVISLLLHVFGQNPYFVTLKSLPLDKAMAFQATVSPDHDPTKPPMVAIDVDEDTWRDPRWGGGVPVRAPRDRLLQLINYALDKDAKYVVVDVIIEGKDATLMGNDDENEEFKRSIEKDVLPRLKMCESVKDCKTEKECLCVPVNNCHCLPKFDQHVLFVRTLLHATETDLLPRWRRSPLDEIIDSQPVPRLLHAVAPYFVVSRDGLVREWTLWQAGCRLTPPSNHWRVLPSVQLVVASLHFAPAGVVDTTAWETAGRGDPCDPLPSLEPRRPEGEKEKKARIDKAKAIDRAVSNIDRSLRETLAGRLGPHGAFDGDEWKSAAHDLRSRILFKYRDWSRPDLIGHLSAREIISRRPDPTFTKDLAVVPDPTVMAGAVVVIGQSFEEARDSHQTPISMMSGPLVILNSIDSMISPGVIRDLSLPKDTALEVTLIGLIGFAFAWFRSVGRAVLVLNLVLVPVMILGTYLLFARHALWWDYALPSLSIGIHRGFAYIVSFGHAVKKRFGSWRHRHKIPEVPR